MAKTTNTNTTTEVKEFTVSEIVEGMLGVFPIGLAKDKNNKNIYARKVAGADGKPDTKKTKIMVKLCLPARKDAQNEKAKFISASVSLENASLFKANGIDLGVKGNNPIRVRYNITDYTSKREDGTYEAHTMREITNVGTWNPETKSIDWVKKAQPKPQAQAEPAEVEISDEDLPF